MGKKSKPELSREAKLASAAILSLKVYATYSDHETAHWKADGVLTQLLIDLGFGEVVDEYHKIEKWYA